MRWILKRFFNFFCLSKKPSYQYHLEVMRPCQLHGKKSQATSRDTTHEETLNETYVTNFLNHKIPLRTSRSNSGSQDGESAPKRIEMDKLECEQWLQKTRFKNWKISFGREVVTGPTHPRQVSDWLSEIDQASSMQDMDDAGSVFGCTQMQIETRDSQIAKGLMKIMNSDFKRKVQVIFTRSCQCGLRVEKLIALSRETKNSTSTPVGLKYAKIRSVERHTSRRPGIWRQCGKGSEQRPFTQASLHKNISQ